MGTLLVMYVVCGGLLIALSLPLLRGKVPPNAWYGFRVPSTMGNPELWYPVNRMMARWLLFAGLITVAGSVALYFVPGISLDAYAWLSLLLFTAPLTVGIFASVRRLRQLQRASTSPNRPTGG